MRVTPEYISELKENEVFVFGSNVLGIHGAGAAKLAYQKFWAVYGKGFGFSGQTFAIPTKDEQIQTLSLEEIKKYVDSFVSFVKDNPEKIFLVTEIGCGLAGYSPTDVAPLFRECMTIENVYLPKRFLEVFNED
jgi:hypothetical protein